LPRPAEGLGDLEFRSFRIIDGVVTEEPVTVIPADARPA
jgi:hypothetical protein